MNKEAQDIIMAKPKCKTCGGSGRCQACKGTGGLAHISSGEDDDIDYSCDKCDGSGKCPDCQPAKPEKLGYKQQGILDYVNSEPAKPAEELREELAQLAHEQWSGWIKYMFEKCLTDYHNKTLIVPKWAVERWSKQAKTPYTELSIEEKDSDQTEADKFLALFQPITDTLRTRVEKIKTCQECGNEHYKDGPKSPCPWCIANTLQENIEALNLKKGLTNEN